MKLDTVKMMQSLNEEEVYAFMRNVLLRLDFLDTTDYTEEEFITDLRKLKKGYREIYEHRTNPLRDYKEKQIDKVHIVFDLSSYGTLKIALRGVLAVENEKVITFSDTFSIGPIWRLHTEEGMKNRKDWLFYNLNVDEEYMDDYKEEFARIRAQIEAIPDETPITIWYGDNGHEQTGLRLALYLLKEKPNPIMLINTTKEYNNIFKRIDGYPVQTAEITQEKLAAIYEETADKILTSEQRKEFEDEWLALSESTKKLRIWKNDLVHSVSEDYFDSLIIQSLQYLHEELGNNDFVKSARLIGEVIGRSLQVVGDEFIEYRVRSLIVNGVFEIKGVPKAMRFYEVKFHEPNNRLNRTLS